MVGGRSGNRASPIPGWASARHRRRRGPWRSHEDVEFATLEWVWWFNNHRLLEPIGYVPPVEYEEAYYRAQEAQATEPILN